jgi:hypothetical protein
MLYLIRYVLVVNLCNNNNFSQIKNKYQLTGTKVVKKVAEARARKKRRALLKLKAAKKQANLMAENSELNERQKVKVLSVSIYL